MKNKNIGSIRMLMSLCLVLLLAIATFATLGVVLAATPSLFVYVNEPIGIVATTDRLLYTQYSVSAGDPCIFSVDSNGIVSVFAPTFPTVDGPIEKYLDISPGLGGFPPDYVYVIQGQQIYKITPDGSTVTLFVNIPSLHWSHTAITFDRVGTFGYDMIITSPHGEIWRVNSAGTATFLTNVGAQIESPEVVPVGVGPLGGQVWVAAEHLHTVFAINPTGVVSVVATGISYAETVDVIPDTVYEFAGGAYFVTGFPFGPYPTGIFKFPASDFAGLGGKVLVAGEYGLPIVMISATDSGYTVSTFDPTTRHHEGATFVRPPARIIVPMDIKPASWPNPLNLASRGVLPVAVCGTAEFDVTTINASTIKLTREGLNYGVSPIRWAYEDVATPWTGEPGGGHALGGDGYLDLALKFSKQEVITTLGLDAFLGQKIPLIITGNLNDAAGGTPFTGQDYVWILNLPGDANDDMVVNILDVGGISAHWCPGPPESPLGYSEVADFNVDGAVDVIDLAIVSANWEQIWQP